MNNLTLPLKEREREEHGQPKASSRTEIVKVGAERNEVENKIRSKSISARKGWFSEKTSKTDKPLAGTPSGKETKRARTNGLPNDRGDMTAVTLDTRRVLLEDCGRLYATKFNNREETEKFLELSQSS